MGTKRGRKKKKTTPPLKSRRLLCRFFDRSFLFNVFASLPFFSLFCAISAFKTTLFGAFSFRCNVQIKNYYYLVSFSFRPFNFNENPETVSKDVKPLMALFTTLSLASIAACFRWYHFSRQCFHKWITILFSFKTIKKYSFNIIKIFFIDYSLPWFGLSMKWTIRWRAKYPPTFL